MKSLLKKIYHWFNPIYKIVYKTMDGRIEMYTIEQPRHRHEFGNMKEGKSVVGFRSFCINRDSVRSFRYDRIISLNKI